MMPSLPIEDPHNTRDSRWLAAGRAQARMRPLDSQPVAPPILSRTVPAARSPLQQRHGLQAARPQCLRRSRILLPEPAANSP